MRWIPLSVRPPPLVCTRATNGPGTCAVLSANWRSPPATMPEMASIALAYSAPAETGCKCYRTPLEGRWAGRQRVKSAH